MRKIYIAALVLLITATNVICAVISCRNSARSGIQEGDAEPALAMFDQSLRAQDWLHTYDALLAAMRIAPSDQRVFDASLHFIRTAASANHDDALGLAQDVYQRGANLLPFLPPAKLKNARDAYEKIGDELFPSTKTSGKEDPLSDARELLKSAAGSDVPASARTHMLQEAEAELGNQARRIVALPPSKDKDTTWSNWNEVKQRLDNAQKELLALVYQQDCKPRIAAWRTKEAALMQEALKAKVEDMQRVNDQIVALIVEGQRVSRDFTPFAEAGVEAAVLDSRDEALNLDTPLTALAQLREWNYNRWALDWIGKVEGSSGTELDRLRSLSKIDDTRLAPFTAQRFAECWKKLFDKCSQPDMVEATKFRILREYVQ